MSIHKAFSKKQNLQTLYYFFTYIMQNYSLLYNSAFNFTLQRNVQYTVLLIDNFIQFVQTCFKFSIQCFRFLFSKISYMYACNNNQLTTNQFEQQKLLYFQYFFNPIFPMQQKRTSEKFSKQKGHIFTKFLVTKKLRLIQTFQTRISLSNPIKFRGSKFINWTKSYLELIKIVDALNKIRPKFVKFKIQLQKMVPKC
eukprot:TRINITY_DN4898_c1_g1_i8.p1 TRINITY_DN4898_c1_g1~~TRINITY_DN4898_c1_g1_i8.p1  ORF type:complete len:197 (+),score=-13.12 TRINITY_DN4898_c1_g1_i8:460-1050(+)